MAYLELEVDHLVGVIKSFKNGAFDEELIPLLAGFVVFGALEDGLRRGRELQSPSHPVNKSQNSGSKTTHSHMTMGEPSTKRWWISTPLEGLSAVQPSFSRLNSRNLSNPASASSRQSRHYLATPTGPHTSTFPLLHRHHRWTRKNETLWQLRSLLPFTQ